MSISHVKYAIYYQIFPILGKLGLIKPQHIRVAVHDALGDYSEVIKTYSGGYGTFRNEV